MNVVEAKIENGAVREGINRKMRLTGLEHTEMLKDSSRALNGGLVDCSVVNPTPSPGPFL